MKKENYEEEKGTIPQRIFYISMALLNIGKKPELYRLGDLSSEELDKFDELVDEVFWKTKDLIDFLKVKDNEQT